MQAIEQFTAVQQCRISHALRVDHEHIVVQRHQGLLYVCLAKGSQVLPAICIGEEDGPDVSVPIRKPLFGKSVRAANPAQAR